MRALLTATALGASLLIMNACAAGREAPGPTELDQNWKPEQIKVWYEASQGSRLLPLDWAKALELADSQELFLSDAHIERLRYLPYTNSHGERLPVGFVVDRTESSRLDWTALTWRKGQPDKTPWLGLNCSACHTAEIAYGGQKMRVQGGPALSDFQALLVDLRAALAKLQEDSPEGKAKFDRFAQNVLGKANDNADNRKQLAAAVARVSSHEIDLGRLNKTDIAYGFGRLDAFGHIYNKVAYVVAGKDAPEQPADAPVSYPFLWNVPQHDKVQWNGIAPNVQAHGGQTFDIGAMGRNAGEVIGVFADIKPRSGFLKGYPSSLDVHNLDAFEQQLERLRPPEWPEKLMAFGADHKALVDAGQKVFKDHCASCHTVLDRGDLKTHFVAPVQLFKGPNPPGTDIWMACNAYVRTAPTGVLKGTPSDFIGGSAKYEDDAYLSSLLKTTVAGALYEQKGDVIKEAAASFFGVNRPAQITAPTAGGETLKQQQANRCRNEASNILGYKARPLNGVWATAPYLHNGSVPTLYDLLLPEAQRPKDFLVGTRTFDPKRVGYVYASAPGNDFKFDTHIEGNSNAGHNYAADVFKDHDELRWAVVEYLKTL